MPEYIYECDNCGACCVHFWVYPTELDVQREPRIALQVVQDPNGRNCICMGNGCSFLTDHGSCAIHANKPDICSRFPAGSSMCQWARGRSGLDLLFPIYQGK